MDRVATRTDPLTHASTFVYDNNGNLAQVTDRKNQVTQYTYDALDRLTQMQYQDNSTTNYAYDGASRVTQITDSISGTITYTFDDMDRRLSETTPQGTVSYTYYAVGRRSSMSVPNQTTITYSYDAADRMTQIQQGSATVTYSYDNADRVTSMTQPNGVVSEYSYDNGSRLTGITYKKGGVTLGTLSYLYDSLGRRVSMGGSLAQVNLPTTLTTTGYNDGNQQTTFGSQTLSYDNNGNLSSDGTKTYTWNARNQLTAISGGGLSASFSYDALGRRISKTINSTITNFLYDGVNIVQEQAGGSASASGTTSSNTQTYTGREDDGTGLYYYRARYYSPDTQRFISEDPIGLAGGDINQYAYVANNPVMSTDPSGLEVMNYGTSGTVSAPEAFGGRYPMVWFCARLGALSSFSAGFGDLITFGATNKVRNWTGGNAAVDKNSWWYAGGKVAGEIWQALMMVLCLYSRCRCV